MWDENKNELELPIYFSWHLHSLKSGYFGTFCKSFQIREQSSFLNVLYHSALETNVNKITRKETYINVASYRGIILK